MSQRVLIFRLGSLGDTIATLPSFHLVRQSFPGARVTVLTNIPVSTKAAPISLVLDGTGLVDDYMDYPVGLRGPRQLWSLRRRIAERRFDVLIYLAAPRNGVLGVLRDAAFFLACGINRQVGLPLLRRDLDRLPVADSGLYRHESERLVGCLRSLGEPDLSKLRWWDLHLSEAEQKEADDQLAAAPGPSRYLGLSVGTKADSKDWTEPNWKALVRRLNGPCAGYSLVALGSADEAERSSRVLAEWAGPTVNLCGQTTPRISAAILRRCDAFIGHDSGPMHLAACVGTPCVAIFSAQNRPGEWFPWGSGHRVIYHQTECFGCRLNVCVTHQKKCIMSISVDEVLQAICSVLESGTVGLLAASQASAL
jgi:heptosyltransferase III